MKNFLKVLGGIFLALILLFVGVLVYGQQSGEARLADYFKEVQAASIADLQGTFDPELAEIVDTELFARFIKALSDRYGAFKDIEAGAFQFSEKLINGKKVAEYRGTMVFERGELPLKVTFRDGKLAGLTVEDQALGRELLSDSAGTPDNLTAYQAKGQAFWEAAARSDADAAFAMMSEPLQRTVGAEPFKAKVSQVFAGHALKEVRFLSSAVEPGEAPKVELHYQLVVDDATIDAQTTFEFANFKGHLVAFNLGADN
ncbi:MAG: hypothetical protein R3A79_01055 [Nannocystaceae bacterium]